MKKGLVIFLIITALCVLLIYKLTTTSAYEHMTNIAKKFGWKRNKCAYTMNETLKNVLIENEIVNSEEWDLYFPCTYDDINYEIRQMPVKRDAKYFIINNADNLTAKNKLWDYVLEYHKYPKAIQMMPKTYNLDSPFQIAKLKTDYKKGQLYILKKNIQRQEGLKITDNLDEMLGAKKEGYVIVQELLQNPYTIDGRKTNMRFYVLVICKNGLINVYVYNDGFMYYTKEKFVKGSKSMDTNVTTGYIDRAVYKTNPLTHNDMRQYLDKKRELNDAEKELIKNNKLSEIYFNRINDLLKDIYISYVGKICDGNKLKNNMTFQLFGVDIAVDDQLKPMIMEINKGPDMGAKDDRDYKLKKGVITDMLALLNFVEIKHKNGFIQLIKNNVKI
uniref:Tubulin-tyrosine ligase n=1 Tax=viral metagenome TaxID=1070528 RepID=A0A6C0E9Y9_9ZZZZ